MIDRQTVRRILDAANIVEVVSDYVHLTKRGVNYVGLCPFHNERTPSFSVSPARGICHCFSCGKGGSPVNFIMEKEGINFHDALIRLADKYGIKVEERELTDEERREQSQRESMLTVNDWAMRRFCENMKATEEGRNIGLQYFYQRGVTQQAIDKFKLGYALDKPTDLYDAAKRQGYDLEALQQVGLCGIGSQSGKPYDRFRGRVIYPMLNAAGKVIAFGGRGIKGEAAKYINSPESAIYHKSNELYGIYQAKNAIVRQKQCFLVEGYMDVIGMWQSGMENTVASSGTSLTDSQVALIHRFTDKITVIYDGDSAGIHASLRAIDMILAHNMDVRLLLLPDGDDPDSFARKNTPEQFREYVAKHEEDFIDFKVRVYAQQGDSPAARTEALKSVVNSIAQVSDLIQRTMFIQKASQLMKVSEAIVTQSVATAREGVIQAQRKRRENARIEAEGGTPEENKAGAGETSPVGTKTGTVPTGSPDAASQRKPALIPESPSLIYNVEKQVIEYVVKYGMLPFCPSENQEDPEDTSQWLNVTEYVGAELQMDDMSFSIPLFAKIFSRVAEMITAFREQLSARTAGLLQELQEEHEAWLKGMADQTLSIADIEKAEARWKEYAAEKQTATLDDFTADWIGHELGSDPDDDTRRFVLDTIIPRYTLSKYHSKNVHVLSERERLDELVPRAMTEWKDALLQAERKRLEAELTRAATAGDVAKVQELMSKIQEIVRMRSEAAKTLGERIVIPRR